MHDKMQDIFLHVEATSDKTQTTHRTCSAVNLHCCSVESRNVSVSHFAAFITMYKGDDIHLFHNVY